MPDWHFMSVLAGLEIGEPVAVDELAAVYRGQGVGGLAGHDGEQWIVALDGDVPAETLLHNLYHELAHVKLGHIARRQAGAISMPVALRAIVARQDAGEEAHAAAWAEGKLRGMGNWRAIVERRCAGE